MISLFHTLRRGIIRIRPVLVGLWMLVVGLCYVYFYAHSLWLRYPVLHEVRQLGLGETIRRLVTP
jgi:hypothetical protein